MESHLRIQLSVELAYQTINEYSLVFNFVSIIFVLKYSLNHVYVLQVTALRMFLTKQCL